MKVLKEEQFKKIRAMIQLTDGKKLTQVAKLNDCSYSTVWQVRKHESYAEYRNWLDERYEASKARLAAKKAQEQPIETEPMTEPEVAAFVPDTETLSQPVTQEDLAEMEARITRHITKQIGGLRVYMAGPNNVNLVNKLSEKLLPETGRKARFLTRS